MSETRRNFLNALAAGLTGSQAVAQRPPGAGQGAGGGRGSGQGQPGQPATPPRPASEVQVPKMRFGGEEISRLVVGCNCFYGYAHFNQILGAVMRKS